MAAMLLPFAHGLGNVGYPKPLADKANCAKSGRLNGGIQLRAQARAPGAMLRFVAAYKLLTSSALRLHFPAPQAST